MAKSEAKEDAAPEKAAVPNTAVPAKLLVKVRRGTAVLLGVGVKDTRLRYGGGISGIKEDAPLELPLCRIYKRPAKLKDGTVNAEPVKASRNLVMADGSEIPAISAADATRIHDEWDAELAKLEAPESVEAQGRIFSSPKLEAVKS